MAKSKIIIIGAGASGMLAGIIAARNGAKVTIIEQKDRVGKKILATGNGRCNISNRKVSSDDYYYDSREKKLFIETILSQFTVEATIAFFHEIGIDIVEKEDGKLFPRADQATSVVSALLMELDKLKVDIVYQERVEKIEIASNFQIITNNKKYYCNKLIIAGGGCSSPVLGSDGSCFKLVEQLNHTTSKLFPSLVQLKTDYSYLKHLMGTKCNALVSLHSEDKEILKEEFGELLFTEYGISGPPVLQISRVAGDFLNKNLKVYIRIDLVNEYSYEQLEELLINRANRMPKRTMEQLLIGFINSKLIIPILKTSNIDIHKNVSDMTKQERKEILKNLKQLTMKVTGTMDFKNSQVTAGGVEISEIEHQTLESKLVKNMYFCGEIINVDGACGGYNLQWAWSTGFVAGNASS